MPRLLVPMPNDNTLPPHVLLNPATGEIISDVYIKPKLDNPRRIRLTKCYMSFISSVALLEQLSRGSLIFYLRLCHLMTRGNHVYQTQQQLAELYKLDRSVVSKYMAELKHNDVLRGANAHWIINPYYALNGGSKLIETTHDNYNALSQCMCTACTQMCTPCTTDHHQLGV